ncbi:MAG TPA: methyltransferase domain-containing protein [Longimicrobiales bacterium]
MATAPAGRPTSCITVVRDGVARAIRRREARHAVARIAGDIAAGGWFLDLGCGMGYVGALLEQRVGCRSVGCDVAVANEALRRFCVFDGRRLPFRASAFHGAVLAFVLHHARNPLALLREAARVNAGPLFVFEDTPRTRADRIWGRLHSRSFNRKHRIPWRGRVRDEAEWRMLFHRAGLRVLRADRLRRRERFPPVARTMFVLLREDGSAG